MDGLITTARESDSVPRVSEIAPQLPVDIEALQALLAAARAERDAALAERDQARSQIDRLRHLLRQLQRAQFGRRSEKLDPEQLLLALEDIEQAIAGNEADDDKKDPVAARAHGDKRRANRGALPAHLPRVDVTIEPEDTNCPCCRAPMHVIGEETSQRLDVIPAQFRVVVTHRPKYACRACEGSAVPAPAPEPPPPRRPGKHIWDGASRRPGTAPESRRAVATSLHRSHAWAPCSRGSSCLRARSSHPRAADGWEARGDWRGAFRYAPLRPLGPSCRRPPRCRQSLVQYPRVPEAAARDRASPNAGRIAHAAIGAADAAGDQSAKGHDRALRSRRHAPHAPPRPAHAAHRYPQEAVRSRSRAALKSDSRAIVIRPRAGDSKGRSAHDVAVGRATSRACRRDQSIPSTSAASCDAVSRIMPSLIGGHRKAPCSSRFQNSTRPDPSHAKIFTRSARLHRNTKIVPENGSSPSASRTSAASPSAPFLKSTGLLATSTRRPAATAIMSPP